MSSEAPWLALAVDWDESEMWDAMPQHGIEVEATMGERLAWLCLLCEAKKKGRGGKVTIRKEKFKNAHRLTGRSVDGMLSRAQKCGAIQTDGDSISICNWSTYQEKRGGKKGSVSPHSPGSAYQGPRTKDQPPITNHQGPRTKGAGLLQTTVQALRDTAVLMGLIKSESDRSNAMVSFSERDQLRVVGAAERALEIGDNPVKLFTKIITNGWWDYISDEQEQRATARLKAYRAKPAGEFGNQVGNNLNGSKDGES